MTSKVVLCYGVPAASAARGMVSYLPSSPHLDDTNVPAGTQTRTRAHMYLVDTTSTSLHPSFLSWILFNQSFGLQSLKSLVTSTSAIRGNPWLQIPSAIFPSCSKTISSLHRAPSHEDVLEAMASSLDVIHAWEDFTRISTTPVI